MPSYKGHRYPVEIINHCVWLYFRFPLSFREVEELMLARGVAVSYETIRRWCAKFGQAYANQAAPAAPAPRRGGTSTRCSSGLMAGCSPCGARSTRTATCSTFSSSHAETRWRPSDSSASCAGAGVRLPRRHRFSGGVWTDGEVKLSDTFDGAGDIIAWLQRSDARGGSA